VNAVARLRATLAAVLVTSLDSWTGVGLLAVGLQRQRWDLQLTEYGDGHWRGTFYVTGMAHSIVAGSAWEPTLWRAVQRAAWNAIGPKRPARRRRPPPCERLRAKK
jgi:hypothetical protein